MSCGFCGYLWKMLWWNGSKIIIIIAWHKKCVHDRIYSQSRAHRWIIMHTCVFSLALNYYHNSPVISSSEIDQAGYNSSSEHPRTVLTRIKGF